MAESRARFADGDSLIADLTGTSAKRAPSACDYARAFTTDRERPLRSGRYDIRRLKEAILLLVANDVPLGPEWKDHPLKGAWAGCRECHVGRDFLLIYALDDAARKSWTVTFVRAGTHSELFQK